MNAITKTKKKITRSIDLSSSLIKQAMYLPIIYFGMVFLAATFAIDYSHIGQHASELAINESKLAGQLLNLGAYLTGISLICYSIGLLLRFRNQFPISSILLLVFGITFIFGGLYKIGSPWHGLYGIGLSVILLPFAFLAELPKDVITSKVKTVCILAATGIFLYFWSMITQLDPMEYRGLTQRLFGLVVFGFIAYTAFIIKESAFARDN